MSKDSVWDLPLSSTVCTRLSVTLFFLMIRPPPRSTLFPTRRSSDLLSTPRISFHCRSDTSPPILYHSSLGGEVSRSEEHTSELQSHHDLVCRLLLEKKKK